MTKVIAAGLFTFSIHGGIPAPPKRGTLKRKSREE